MAAPKKSDKKQKIIAILLLVGGGLWAYWNYLYKPITKDVLKLRNELAEKQKKLAATRQAAAEFDYLEAEFKVLQIEAKELEKKLPLKRDLPTLLTYITRSMEKHKITIQLFAPVKEIQKTYFSEVPIMIQVTGSYHNLVYFFSEIGQHERIINVFNLNIAPQPQTGKVSADTINASLKLVTYTAK